MSDLYWFVRAWWRDGPSIWLSGHLWPRKQCLCCSFDFWTVKAWRFGFCSDHCRRSSEVYDERGFIAALEA